MVELNAPLRAKLRPSLVMPLLAGLTLETGQSAHCHAEALELKQGQSLASSPRMADFHALQRTLKRRTRAAMPLLAGQSSVPGLHAKVCAEALVLKPGPGHALSHLRVDCHAQLNLLSLRTKNVTRLVYGQLLPLKGFYI